MASKGTLRIAIVGDNSKLDKSLKDAGGMIGGFATGLAGLVAAGGVAAGVAFVGGMMEGFRRDASADKMAAAAGLSPSAADRLGKIAGGVWADAFGESIDDVNVAIEGVISTLGDFSQLGEEGIDRLTRKALTVADVFGVDVSQAISNAGTLISSGLVADADEAFDLMTRGMQEMPKHLREELFEASTEYGKFFNDLGISGEETFALLTKGAEDGMYGIDKAGDAVKEFTIRATDMSKASSDAYKAIGLDANEMANDLLAGGETARTAFQTIVDGLLAIEDPAERGVQAVALFGTPIEDLSVQRIPEFLDALSSMEGGLGNVEGALDRAGQTAYDNFETRWTEAIRSAKQRFFTFADEHIIPKAEEVFDAFDEGGVGAAMAKMGELWEEAWPEIESWLANDVVPWLTDEFGPAVGQAMLDAGLAGGKALLSGLWEGIKDVPGMALDVLRNPDAGEALSGGITGYRLPGLRRERDRTGGIEYLPQQPGRPGDVLFRHAGGQVPGAPGATVPIWAQAGETITRASDADRRGGGPTININVSGSVITERDLLASLRRELARHDRLSAGAA